jgi:Ca2+-binding RTX toxin-like protein
LGNDTIDGNFGNDTIWGGDGNDILTDGQGSNYLDGEDGGDRLTAQGLTGNHTLSGGLGNDTINGTGQTLLLDGGDGSDNLLATGYLNVGGVDTYVQNGSATLVGGAGDDGYGEHQELIDGEIITVGHYGWDGGLSASYLGHALLQGGDGRDYLNAYAIHNAILEGGAGQDRLEATVNGGYVVQNIDAGYGANYSLDGGADDDTLTVSGNSWIHYGLTELHLEGGTGNDTLSVSDSAFGSNAGAIAQATLSGGDGDDRLTASGVLQLTMTGGLGADTFVLTAQQYRATQASYQFNTQDATVGNGWDYGYVTGRRQTHRNHRLRSPAARVKNSTSATCCKTAPATTMAPIPSSPTISASNRSTPTPCSSLMPTAVPTALSPWRC